MCYCHDKRLRNFLARLFFTISIVVLFFVFLFKMAVFSLFLRNVLLPIEILKIKILEHSDPPSQHFFVHKAFSHSFLCSRKVVLCHLAEWHNHPGCHLDPGSSLYRPLLGFALLVFDLVREASEAPSGTAHEEHSLRVMIVPLRSLILVVPIAPYINSPQSRTRLGRKRHFTRLAGS